MPSYMYERLSAQDNSFLVAEHANAPLHIAAVGIYDESAVASRDGGVDIRRFKQFIEARLHEIPRYRQKLMWVPIENRPVWVDDPHFNIDYHIRHSALPRPGGIEELKKLTARITTRTLDRSRPLWELWVVEGLEGDRFATVSKIHHCMIDGLAGADLAQILNSPFQEVEIPEPRPYLPRPAPTETELLLDAVQRVVGMPWRALRGLASLRAQAAGLREELETRARALTDILGQALHGSSDTPLNGRLGPHRRVDWLTLPLDDVKAVRRGLDCTVNDVVLATVTGAVRHYLFRRGVDPRTIDFRVSAPVSMRSDPEKGRMGNRVSAWILRLPIGEESPAAWVAGIKEKTRELKTSKQALGVEMMMQAAEYAPSSLMALGARVAAGPINMIVTNVPGPQIPLYTLGARMLEMQPLVPLLDGTGLGIALFSYDGKLHVGLNADYEIVPDIGTFTALFAQSFMALADAAGLEAPAEAELAGTPDAVVHVGPQHAPVDAVEDEPLAVGAEPARANG
jgi:WS/DGAT/MGAT family acyltransferase